MRIAIDAMGGDHAPQEIVRGTYDSALKFPDATHILVGDRGRIESELKPLGASLPNIEIAHATQVVSMDDSPVKSVLSKRDSSIAVAVKLVKNKQADAVVSAGNTGAAVASATFPVLGLGLLEGVKRAGILVPMPTEKGVCAIIDVGANINCKPIHLLQYGVMGAIYSKYIFNGSSDPAVGLLNIGEESAKGTNVARQTYQYFKRSNLNFAGNAEGHDIFSGKFQVVVCDGFMGNTLLKMVEGLIQFIFKQISSESQNDTNLTKALSKCTTRLDYSEYGGAPLLGVKGCVIISHGRSRAKAITSALKVAHDFVANKVNEHIVRELPKPSWWNRMKDWYTTKPETEQD